MTSTLVYDLFACDKGNLHVHSVLRSSMENVLGQTDRQKTYSTTDDGVQSQCVTGVQTS